MSLADFIQEHGKIRHDLMRQANRARLTGNAREQFFARNGMPDELSIKTLLIDLPKILRDLTDSKP